LRRESVAVAIIGHWLTKNSTHFWSGAGLSFISLFHFCNLLLSCGRMFAQVQFPETLAPEDLDGYLAKGWFRMGQSIFTTNFLHFKHEFYSAIWLRTDLSHAGTDKNEQRLFRQNAQFEWSISKSTPDQEKEVLFQRYKQAISFETSPTLHQLLYGKFATNVFDTYEVSLRDNGKLIATGYFDMGRTSAAGIISVYDPDYRKFSLGKFLIYLKIKFAREKGIRYFYPGYFVPGYQYFDYKLTIGKDSLEYFDMISGGWFPMDQFRQSPLSVMLSRLADLRKTLEAFNIESRAFNYEFFDANLFPELKDAELFDYPVFLYCFSFREEVVNPLIVFDVLTGRFRLFQCVSLWTSNLPPSKEDVYSYHLLKVEFEYFHSASPEAMAKKLLIEVKQ
jgi:leucyl-tRNA---protein transferase